MATQLQEADKKGYTYRHLKGDVVVGLCSGAVFGTVYSFFYWHAEKEGFKLFGKSRNSALLYLGANAVKMGVGWALMRSTWNWTKKEDLTFWQKMASMSGAFGVICCIM